MTRLHVVPDMDFWLEISSTLLFMARPPGSGAEAFGHGMPADAFAALVERENDAVDRALVAMALADGQEGVDAIRAALSNDALIALCSRWAHYHYSWQQMHLRGERQWMPTDRNQVWRAVFLSMTSERGFAAAAAHQLWPEAFAAPTPEGSAKASST